jgi:hypothetical protein
MMGQRRKGGNRNLALRFGAAFRCSQPHQMAIVKLLADSG